jgi:hypothetical protein
MRKLALLALSLFATTSLAEIPVAPPLPGYLAEIALSDSDGAVAHVIIVNQTKTLKECKADLIGAVDQHKDKVVDLVTSGVNLHAYCFNLQTGIVAFTLTPADLQKDESSHKELDPEQAQQPRHST